MSPNLVTIVGELPYAIRTRGAGVPIVFGLLVQIFESNLNQIIVI